MNLKLSDFTEDDIIMQYNLRQKARFEHPGLCAEEYERIIHLVIKHIFNWDVETQKSNGVGLFSKVLAWCLATEEQGRKNLHGHFLLFIENWKEVLKVLQQGSTVDKNSLLKRQATKNTKALYKDIFSAQLFSDFQAHKPLSDRAVFHHEDCRGKRKESVLRFAVKPVSMQAFREMRHKSLCFHHKGNIASCERCDRLFSVNEIVANALNHHLGNGSACFDFPEAKTPFLDHIVYELQKDFEWTESSEHDKALRYFASNALSNMHLTTHASRCFKKSRECYACLPDVICDGIQIIYDEDYSIWSDWLGNKTRRYIFRLQPHRRVEDTFMNSHNKSLTELLCCNTNVLLGITGRILHYVTCYHSKSQQKEENRAFEKISEILLKHLKKQVIKCACIILILV